MKKLLFVSILILTAILACTAPPPKIDTQLEKQVQTESQEFESLLSRFVAYVGSIKNPGDISIRSVFPDSWLFEDAGQFYSIGVPISKDVVKGLTQVRETDPWTYYLIITPNDHYYYGWWPYGGWPIGTVVYLSRIGHLTPDTDTYIVQGWTGTFSWGNIQGGAGDKRNYPTEVNPGFFKSYRIVNQPYMVPPEATHGVYQEPRIFNPSGGNISTIAGIARQIWDANPYVEKSDAERAKTPPIQQLIIQIPGEVAKLNNDVNYNLNTVGSFESKYFTPNSASYNKQNELADYKNSMATIKSQLSGIDSYLQQLTKWDFSRLYKYRMLQVK